VILQTPPTKQTILNISKALTGYRCDSPRCLQMHQIFFALGLKIHRLQHSYSLEFFFSNMHVVEKFFSDVSWAQPPHLSWVPSFVRNSVGIIRHAPPDRGNVRSSYCTSWQTAQFYIPERLWNNVSKAALR
jgi:hypothetical protein